MVGGSRFRARLQGQHDKVRGIWILGMIHLNRRRMGIEVPVHAESRRFKLGVGGLVYWFDCGLRPKRTSTMATLGWSVCFYNPQKPIQLTDPRQQDSAENSSSARDTKEDAIDPALREVCPSTTTHASGHMTLMALPTSPLINRCPSTFTP